MPPKVRFQREAVVDAAYQLARTSGLEAVNARAIAKALGCSTQPLFREFESMEDIRAEVVKLALTEYGRRIAQATSGTAMPPYKSAGMAYILFAREEPQLFRMLFMCDRSHMSPLEPDETLDYILELLTQKTGYTHEEALDFHLQMWVFTHGLATMVATHYIDFSNEELEALLSRQFAANMAARERL